MEPETEQSQSMKSVSPEMGGKERPVVKDPTEGDVKGEVSGICTASSNVADADTSAGYTDGPTLYHVHGDENEVKAENKDGHNDAKEETVSKRQRKKMIKRQKWLENRKIKR